MVVWITTSIGVASCYEKFDTKDVSIIDVRDLVDGKGNPPTLIMNKISQCLDALKQGKKVIICCDRGLSRSSIIAIAVLARTRVSFDHAVRMTIEKIGHQEINLDLLEDIYKVVK
jgi:protein-tyrosine phosphatase